MKRNYQILYLLAFIKFIFPFVLQNNFYELQRDEFLYLAEAHHMAWGFMEIPPLLSVFAWISNLFGDSIFWIKFWPCLFGALTYIIVGKMIISLGGKTFALFLGFLPFVFGAYLRMHFLFQPNFLEIFFWTMIAFSLVRYIQTEKNSWLYILGISVGLGMNSKYSVAFFVISIIGGLLLTKQRKIFLNKHLYFAALIGFLLFIPNLLWQYNRHFPVFVHMKELQRTQLQYVSPASFLTDQLLMNLPCVFIWIAGLYFIVFKQKRRYIIFVWAYLFVITLLLYFQGKSYYSMGVYPVLFAFGAYHLECFTTKYSRAWKYVFIIIPLVLGILLIPLLLPVAKPQTLASYYKATHLDKAGVLKWEDLQNHALPQDFADMLGWKEITEKTAKAYSALNDEEKKHALIFCDNYGQAGAVNFYGKKYNLPGAYSDNASFLYWLPDSLHVNNMILVTDDQQEMHHDFIKDFTSVILSDSVTNEYAREKGSLIIILKGANEKFNQMFREKIQKDKDRFK
ncbi:MAG: glycosyltransferase family 39 protein [Bacteroidota bacterium]|nr:glycosyltransferase family 39 protein [Bacteroidota bacterium]